MESDMFRSCPVIANIYRTSQATALDGKIVSVHSHLPYEDAAILFDVVSVEKPKRAFELGMAFGASSLAILAASQEISLESIDPYQNDGWHGCGIRAVRDSGFAGRHVLNSEFDYVALPRMLDNPAYDFAFIDGWHTFDHAFLNWWYADKLISVGGVIGFDDCYMPSIAKAISFVLSHREYTEVYRGRSSRTRYFRKMSSYTPEWNFFTEF